MLTEGIGIKPPAPVAVVLTDGNMRLIAAEAKRQAEARNYNGRSDSWGKGFGISMVVGGVALQSSESPIFVGKIGEYATAHILTRRLGVRIEPSAEVLTGGDGGADLIVVGKVLQIKTRRSVPVSLIRVRDDRGFSVFHKCDAFVFCSWDGVRTVRILGWLKSGDVLSKQEVNARCGDHKNVEVHDSELLPFSRLVDELRLCL